MDAETRVVSLAEFDQSLMRMQDEFFFLGLAEFVPTKGVSGLISATHVGSGNCLAHP